MKKILNTALIYLVVSVVYEVVNAGIIEATQTAEYVGGIAVRPMSLAIHSHLLALGFMFFVLNALLEKVFGLTSQKSYRKFFSTYNIGLVITVIIMGYRSFGEIFAYPVSKGLAMGVGTLGHILMTVGFFFFFSCLKKAALSQASPS